MCWPGRLMLTSLQTLLTMALGWPEQGVPQVRPSWRRTFGWNGHQMSFSRWRLPWGVHMRRATRRATHLLPTGTHLTGGGRDRRDAGVTALGLLEPRVTRSLTDPGWQTPPQAVPGTMRSRSLMTARLSSCRRRPERLRFRPSPSQCLSGDMELLAVLQVHLRRVLPAIMTAL